MASVLPAGMPVPPLSPGSGGLGRSASVVSSASSRSSIVGASMSMGAPSSPTASHPTLTTVGGASPTSANTATTSDMDERSLARAALDAAEEQLRKLCASHAPTFVAVEKRGRALEESLTDLLEALEGTTERVHDARHSLLVEEESSKSAKTDKKKEGEEDDGEESVLAGRKSRAAVDDSERRSAATLLASLAERHRLRRRTLMQHSSLLELLELPSLMDACVRSNLYDDALSIAGFANTLERRHLLEAPSGSSAGVDNNPQSNKTSAPSSSSNAVVANVVMQVRRRESDLRRHLLHRLRANVSMPQCLEVVTALRRLNGAELERRGRLDSAHLERWHASMELRLAVDFFEARDGWLDSGGGADGSQPFLPTATSGAGKTTTTTTAHINNAAGNSMPSEQLSDAIERYRTRCFEIATQFLAIFRLSGAASSSLSLSSTPSGLQSPLRSPSSKASSSSSDYSAADSSLMLLSMWTTRRIQIFLATLDARLTAEAVDASTLRDALDAATFFATSMGRIGADFQYLLPPIFERRLFHLVTSHWSNGAASFREILKVCRDAGVASPLYSDSALPALQKEKYHDDDHDHGANADDDREEEEDNIELSKAVSAVTAGGTPPPPRKLLALPPMARFLNSFLTGLNELRRCLLPGVFPLLRHELLTLLDNVRSMLVSHERSVLTPGLRGEAAKLRQVAALFKTTFDKTLEPYMKMALEVAFGSVDVQRELVEQQRQAEEVVERKRQERKRAEEAAAAAAAAAAAEVAAARERERLEAEEAAAAAAAAEEEALAQGGDDDDDDDDDDYEREEGVESPAMEDDGEAEAPPVQQNRFVAEQEDNRDHDVGAAPAEAWGEDDDLDGLDDDDLGVDEGEDGLYT